MLDMYIKCESCLPPPLTLIATCIAEKICWILNILKTIPYILIVLSCENERKAMKISDKTKTIVIHYTYF
jgi:hypothetical protein